MLKAKTRWQLAAYDEKVAEELARSGDLPPFIAKLLVIRGIQTAEQARNFLQISPQQFHDPFLLDGMAKSVERIRRAIEQGEPICVYGDYDADGVSSTALVVHLFRELGAQFDYYIPNRFTEGYGLHNEALKQIRERGFGLVVTVDTGISAVEQARYAQELGLDLIITDHHEPPAQIPEAYAVINPKKPNCPYPFEMLAGVGVAFKLAHALLGEPPMHLIDFAAIGTIADLVPLVDENRILASLGLRRLNQTHHVGLQALVRVCGLAETELSSGHVGFALGPRINAGGRLETAETAIKLMTTTDAAEADELAAALDELNRERQELVHTMTEEAVAMVLAEFPPEENQVLVVAKEGWNVGVVGIVASRLVEKFYRPTIVLGIDPEKGTAKGSARSIAGFDMYEALTACKELLPHYGGHTMAAGMTLPVENLAPLRVKLNQLAQDWLTEEDFMPLTRVDVAVAIEQVDLALIEQMEALAPFGMGNPTPLILLEQVESTAMRLIGREDSHLKCSLVKDGKAIDAIGFQLAHLAAQITPKAKLQVLGELSINEWNGNRKAQLTIRDMAVPHQQIFDWRGSREKRAKWLQVINQDQGVLTVTFRQQSFQEISAWLSEFQQQANKEIRLEYAGAESYRLADGNAYRTLILYDLPSRKSVLRHILCQMRHAERIYCLFGDPDASFDLVQFPTRDQFKLLYQMFRQFPMIEKGQLDALARKLQLKRAVLDKMLAVFLELQFIQEEAERVRLHPEPAKQALDRSQFYQEWQEEAELAEELLLSSYESLVQYMNQWVEPVPAP
ncbi:single-stranded-DNA-specific exonuclease RecJ [Brevibacillus fulvus]|uniref:Single-stranded-DNA-specific exonuclease RecJ n=1 Tax=Brevibacillus fulvus TaxID=1125967 RepID=A0A938XYI0_9BACL|nr:single-stranded-DNA-specific exonuclease RecJ [Brevibacillus fulvus]MBM7589978.1 single-stranded-DNA-specific exonuclease [Brevibacillus fulvus]